MVTIVHATRKQPKAYGEKGSNLSAQLLHPFAITPTQASRPHVIVEPVESYALLNALCE